MKRGKVSDIRPELPGVEGEAETRVQIRERLRSENGNPMSAERARVFLDGLDAKGILRSKRVLIHKNSGMNVNVTVYWVEIETPKKKTR